MNVWLDFGLDFSFLFIKLRPDLNSLAVAIFEGQVLCCARLESKYWILGNNNTKNVNIEPNVSWHLWSRGERLAWSSLGRGIAPKLPTLQTQKWNKARRAHCPSCSNWCLPPFPYSPHSQGWINYVHGDLFNSIESIPKFCECITHHLTSVRVGPSLTSHGKYPRLRPSSQWHQPLWDCGETQL